MAALTLGNTAPASSADLALTGFPTTGGFEVAQDESFQYRFVVSATGGGASGLVVDTELPACMPQHLSPSTGCDNDPDGATRCELGALTDGGERTFSLAVSPESCTPLEAITTTSVVSGLTEDSNSDNDTLTMTLNVGLRTPAVIDVALRIAAAPPVGAPGEDVTYTVEVENLGNIEAGGRELHVEVTPGFELRAASIVPLAGEQGQRVSIECLLDDGFRNCPLPGIGRGTTIAVDLTFAAPPDGDSRATITLFADAIATDSNPANDVVTAGTTVAPPVTGDFDGDGCVSTRDLARFVAQYRSREYLASMDFDGDGELDTDDIAQLKAVFGSGARC